MTDDFSILLEYKLLFFYVAGRPHPRRLILKASIFPVTGASREICFDGRETS